MASEFEVYDEPATLTGTTSLGTEPIFADFGGGYKVGRNLAVALGYVNYNTESDMSRRREHPASDHLQMPPSHRDRQRSGRGAREPDAQLLRGVDDALYGSD